jgi:hypothetical protein
VRLAARLPAVAAWSDAFELRERAVVIHRPPFYVRQPAQSLLNSFGQKS